jgi:hypothetical protein
MRRAGLIPLFFFAVAAAGSPVSAQVQLGGEAGLARLRQTGIPESTARTLGANLDAVGQRSWFRAAVLGALASEDQWTGQALASASLFGPAQQRVRWELSGTATSFGESNTRSAYSAEAMARAHMGDALLGAALGLGGGVRRADGGRQPVGHGQLIGWTSLSGNRFVGELSVVRTNTERPSRLDETMSFSYADLSGSWRRDDGGFSLGATAGARLTSTSILSRGGWGSADAAVWIVPRLALVGGVGRSLDDVVRGVPPIRFVSVGIRITGQKHATVLRSTPRARPGAAGPQIVAGRERVEIRANGATRVELMADFTDWNPVELTLVSGVWRLERSLSPGLHRIALRIDGGEWITPSNLPRAAYDLGGFVGLITIP